VGRSRKVLAVPATLPLWLVARQFDGSHESAAWDDSLVHRFETVDRARVLP
jgi:hypothetical protein